VARDVSVDVDGDDLADGGHNVVVTNLQPVERLSRQPLVFLDQAEQQMLGADIGLMEGACFVLRQNQHLTCLVCEFLE